MNKQRTLFKNLQYCLLVICILIVVSLVLARIATVQSLSESRQNQTFSEIPPTPSIEQQAALWQDFVENSGTVHNVEVEACPNDGTNYLVDIGRDAFVIGNENSTNFLGKQLNGSFIIADIYDPLAQKSFSFENKLCFLWPRTPSSNLEPVQDYTLALIHYFVSNEKYFGITDHIQLVLNGGFAAQNFKPYQDRVDTYTTDLPIIDSGDYQLLDQACNTGQVTLGNAEYVVVIMHDNKPKPVGFNHRSSADEYNPQDRILGKFGIADENQCQLAFTG